jgi:hypothetical protein
LQREVELVGRIVVVGQLGDDVLEREEDARLDLEREMEVEGSVAALFGMEVDLPNLAQRVRLDEVALVVHVEAVVDGVVLELGDVAGDVDGGHRL